MWGCTPVVRSGRDERGQALGVCDERICFQLASGGGRYGLRRIYRQEGACCGSARAADNDKSNDTHLS